MKEEKREKRKDKIPKHIKKKLVSASARHKHWVWYQMKSMHSITSSHPVVGEYSRLKVTHVLVSLLYFMFPAFQDTQQISQCPEWWDTEILRCQTADSSVPHQWNLCLCPILAAVIRGQCWMLTSKRALTGCFLSSFQTSVTGLAYHWLCFRCHASFSELDFVAHLCFFVW